MAWSIESLEPPPRLRVQAGSVDPLVPVRAIGRMLTFGYATPEIELAVGGAVLVWIVFRIGRSMR
jgi:hypothetical protein